MKGHVDGTIENHASQIDILVTGCEVSLWVAEQFVSDLQKCFPKLYVKAVSSNKLLGLFGQDLSMPAIGFPYTQKTLDMKVRVMCEYQLAVLVKLIPNLCFLLFYRILLLLS